MDLLDQSPYLFDEGAARLLLERQQELARRVEALHAGPGASQEALQHYYGEKRFEEVAQSNALEGSPLTVGETRLAVQRGGTISGHDPAFSHDARSLHAALQRMAELAADRDLVTDIEQLQEIHGIILGDRPGAGVFRKEPITISGSGHSPPDTWAEIMSQMEDWEAWSCSRPMAPALLRAAVLHAWLTQIHPHIDGNGRAARAVLNLELIRAGFPPIIIRRKDRERYLDALHHADETDLGPLLDLLLVRAGDALLDRERVAKRIDQFNPLEDELRRVRERHASIFNDAARLLLAMVEDVIVRLREDGLTVEVKRRGSLDAADLEALQREDAGGAPQLWEIDCEAPGLACTRYLGFVGFRSAGMRRHLPDGQPGPAIVWSVPNPDARFPPWVRARDASPGAEEMTVVLPAADQWYARNGQRVERLAPSAMAERIATGLREALRDRLTSL